MKNNYLTTIILLFDALAHTSDDISFNIPSAYISYIFLFFTRVNIGSLQAIIRFNPSI